MKKNLLLLIVLTFTLSFVNAQVKFEKVKTSVISNSTLTQEVFTQDNATFPIYQTKSGKKFVKAVSKKDNEYPVWIYTKTEYTFQELPVYVTDNGKYCVYSVTATGYPHAIWIKQIIN